MCAGETPRRQLCKSGAQKRRVGHKSRFWQHVGIRWRHYSECLNQKVFSIFTLGTLNSTDKDLKFIINIHCIICLYLLPLSGEMCSLIPKQRNPYKPSTTIAPGTKQMLAKRMFGHKWFFFQRSKNNPILPNIQPNCILKCEKCPQI